MPSIRNVAVFAATLVVLLPTSPADLVAHYALDETAAGSDAADSIGSNDGSAIGTGNITKGFASPKAYLGTAYDFALRGGLDIGANAATRPTDQWTMTWWMRPTTLNAFDRIYETLSGTGASGNGIRIDLGGNPGDSLRVLIRDGNGATSTQHTHSLNMSTGTWYFCAMRYDSTEGNGAALKTTIFPAGGSNVTAGDITSATQQAGSLGTGPIPVHGQGAYLAADDAGASGSNDFGGALDDFAIFQTGNAFGVLTDAEIAQVHNIGALAFDPPAPPPTVQSFTATPSDVASGASVTLSWNVSDSTSVEITPDIGAVAATGSTSVTADVTKIYTLTATNAEGSVNAQAQITVDGLALPPRLSEFVANNGGSLIDGDGNESDWIEIHNPNATDFDLSGYYLTDDPAELDKWPFPAGSILTGDQYLIVFASGQPTSTYTDGGGNLHTNFSLRAGGEYLALIAPDATTVLQEFNPYPPQQQDISFGDAGYFDESTPGAANSAGFQGFVADTKFSIDRGFFSAPFAVTITTDTPGAEIYTTTDGSNPTPTNGTLYTAPVNITTTTVLRAAAFLDGFAPTNTDTHTYLFLDDVLTQPNNPPGLPSTWAGKIADYEMDPDIVNSPDYSAEMIPSLQTYATLSVAIDPDDFYGSQGIYQNPQSQGDAWERAVSAELMTHDDSEPGFQIDAGFRIQGGSSRNPDTPKHSLSLRFRRQYGEGKLNYDLYENAPYGDTATDAFDFLQLRSGYNYGWVHRHWYQGENAQYARDQFANDLFLAMGNTGTHGRWVHLYINSIYWGIYHLHERPDSNHMAAYFGGSNDDYDAINSNVATDGSVSAYNAMAAHAANNIANAANYEALKGHLDIDSFIDYMLMNFYIGNQDWDGHNWRAAGQGPGGIPFQFFPWDTEISISPFGGGRFDPPTPVEQSLTSNVTGKNGNNRPTGIHQDLTTNAEYRLQFADSARRNMFNGGPLTPAGAAAIWNARADDMFTGILAESARWGDYRFDVQQAANWPQASYDRYTRDDHYLDHKSWILGTYLPQRTDIVLAQLRARNLYPDTDAPDFAQHGGQVPGGFALAMTNPGGAGNIIYTLDGSDPRDPAAITYSGPVTLADSGTVNARILNGAEWSALTSAEFIVGTPADATNLVVSEIYYNPPGAEETGEFIELVNISGDTLQLGGITFAAGLTYTAPLGLELAPGAYIVLTPADYTGALDNTGETITLEDASGAVIESFTYNDKSPWPEAPDGDGQSLTRIAPASQLDPNLPTSWRSSTAAGGTPGTTDATTFPGGALAGYAFPTPPAPSATEVNITRNPTADDIIYSAELSTDLVVWTDAGTAYSSEDADLTVALPAGTRYFVRFRATERP